MIEISIVVPLYNKEKFIRECIFSIMESKNIPEYEVIVIDDHSTDSSVEKAEHLILRYDCMRLIKHKENKERSFTRNQGIEKAIGKYVLCIDADDKIPPDYIQKNYNNIIKNNVDISYTDLKMFGNSNKKIVCPEFDINILCTRPIIHCSAMFKKEVFEKIGGFDTKMKDGWEDYDFWLMAAKLNFQFKKENNTFLLYRQHDTNETYLKGTDSFKTQKKIRDYLRKKHGSFVKL
jgi:GT2 family glycosyltransferase